MRVRASARVRVSARAPRRQLCCVCLRRSNSTPVCLKFASFSVAARPHPTRTAARSGEPRVRQHIKFMCARCDRLIRQRPPLHARTINDAILPACTPPHTRTSEHHDARAAHAQAGGGVCGRGCAVVRRSRFKRGASARARLTHTHTHSTRLAPRPRRSSDATTAAARRRRHLSGHGRRDGLVPAIARRRAVQRLRRVVVAGVVIVVSGVVVGRCAHVRSSLVGPGAVVR